MTDPPESVDGEPAASRPSGSETRAITNRLRRIEGQVRGLQRMVAQDAPCIDILTQVAAVQTALEQVAVTLLEDHVRRWATHAVADRARSSTHETLDALMAAVRRFAKQR
jgi:DNA-binding FrmR family transcriptional regulator